MFFFFYRKRKEKNDTFFFFCISAAVCSHPSPVGCRGQSLKGVLCYPILLREKKMNKA